MYMHFLQESVDNFMRNRAYMKVSQILSHRVIVQNQYLSLTFGGGGKLLLWKYWGNTKNTYVCHVGHLRAVNLFLIIELKQKMSITHLTPHSYLTGSHVTVHAVVNLEMMLYKPAYV